MFFYGLLIFYGLHMVFSIGFLRVLYSFSMVSSFFCYSFCGFSIVFLCLFLWFLLCFSLVSMAFYGFCIFIFLWFPRFYLDNCFQCHLGFSRVFQRVYSMV